MKQQVHVPGLESGFYRYPAAVKHAGLVFVSGVRSTGQARATASKDMPKDRLAKEQGFRLADHDERKVSVDSWATHANLETVLQAAGAAAIRSCASTSGSGTSASSRCYERVRMHFAADPRRRAAGSASPTSSASSRHWIGIDAIAVAPGKNPDFTGRAVVAGVDHRALPSASHYSQAVRTGDLVFTAGHIAIKTAEPGKPLVNSFDDIPAEGRFLATGRSHPDSRDGPIAAQTWYIYNELKKLLAAGGVDFSDVVLSTVYLADVR